MAHLAHPPTRALMLATFFDCVIKMNVSFWGLHLMMNQLGILYIHMQKLFIHFLNTP